MSSCFIVQNAFWSLSTVHTCDVTKHSSNYLEPETHKLVNVAVQQTNAFKLTHFLFYGSSSS